MRQLMNSQQKNQNSLIESLSTSFKTLALIATSTIALISTTSYAAISDTEANAGAFCECNTPDAFPGVVKQFTRAELNDIKEKFETYDQRRHIDRTSPRFKSLNALGQLLVFDESNGKLKGFGTGVLVGDDLVLTNAHVAQKVGQQIKFNVGQTPDNSTAKWADTSAGTVISMGAYDGTNDAHDWALVRLNKPLGKTFGKITPYAFDTVGQMYDANDTKGFVAAGFPGLKDPKHLWGKENAKLDGRDMISSSTSSGMSGGAILWEHQPGKFMLVGLITGSTGRNDQVLLEHGHLGFDSGYSRITNFIEPTFGDEFGPAYRAAKHPKN